MQAASAAVRSAEEDAHKAQDAVCKVKTLDEQEKQRLVKEHLQRVKDLEAKVSHLLDCIDGWMDGWMLAWMVV